MHIGFIRKRCFQKDFKLKTIAKLYSLMVNL
jgi:hypothetical protein